MALSWKLSAQKTSFYGNPIQLLPNRWNVSSRYYFLRILFKLILTKVPEECPLSTYKTILSIRNKKAPGPARRTQTGDLLSAYILLEEYYSLSLESSSTRIDHKSQKRHWTVIYLLTALYFWHSWEGVRKAHKEQISRGGTCCRGVTSKAIRFESRVIQSRHYPGGRECILTSWSV